MSSCAIIFHLHCSSAKLPCRVLSILNKDSLVRFSSAERKHHRKGGSALSATSRRVGSHSSYVLLLLPATIICLLLFLLSKGKSIASSGLDCMNDRKQSVEVVISSKDMPVQNGALCTLASLESLSMPPMQEVVLSADIGCVQCRKRIADVISRMNEVETITVSVREKMVTLSCRYSYPAKATPPKQQLPAIHRKPFSKIAIIKKILRGR
ncbi:hypothetical protein SAY87_015997 [Trapa incisa]|uniref:HMA domain-containing protein n=1 Tax=Trapa incisa TaxID=236973 RepID=A0AAN7L625_9MYRT|nr:hypothetical protein SAY87_015997 [Trapa incisa]